jgi:hypothetical protein
MNVSSEMQALCNNIISTSANRANRLGSLRHETDAIRRDARRMVESFHDSFVIKAQLLHAMLGHETAARKKTVAGLRSGFRKDSRAVRADLAAVKGIWAAIAKG